MWALYDAYKRAERQLWRKHFGEEFTGWHEGKRVQLVWGERVVGHICRGDLMGGHGECVQMVIPAWVFRRTKGPEF